VRKTSGRTITETDFVVHAGHTGDFFPHHMDAEAMKASPWGQRIAHGTMTFAIGIGLTAGEINPLAFTYGYERLRFPKPVFIGDTIHTELTIAGARDDPKRAESRPRHRAGPRPEPARRDRAGLRPRLPGAAALGQGTPLRVH
jgi:acyl dehydratase